MKNFSLFYYKLLFTLIIFSVSLTLIFLTGCTKYPPVNGEDEKVPAYPLIESAVIKEVEKESITAIALGGKKLAYVTENSAAHTIEIILSQLSPSFNMDMDNDILSIDNNSAIDQIPLEKIDPKSAQIQFSPDLKSLWLSSKDNRGSWNLARYSLEEKGEKELFPLENKTFVSNSCFPHFLEDRIIYAHTEKNDHGFLASIIKNRLDMEAPMDLFQVELNSSGSKAAAPPKVTAVDIAFDDAHIVYSIKGTAANEVELWLKNITTNKSKMLSQGENLFSPKFSPDGQWLAYWKLEGENTVLTLYHLEKQEEIKLMVEHEVKNSLSWDARGDTVFYTADYEGQDRIFAASLSQKLSEPGINPGQVEGEDEGKRENEGEAAVDEVEDEGEAAVDEVEDEDKDKNEDELDVEFAAENETDPEFDLVILNGTVINPEKETIKFAHNIGIKGEKVEVITREDISGKEEIDATGLIVSPGFIDVLSYSPNSVGNRYKVADGVTTNLAMHGATDDFKQWFSRYDNQTMILNYGGAVLHGMIRNAVKAGLYCAPNQEQIEEMKKRTEKAILEGAIGLSFSPEYYPGMSEEEIMAIMEVGNKYDLTSFFHVRYSTMYGQGGDNIDALNEVIHYARELDASVQVVHINSTGGTFSMEESLRIIEDAREEGIDITFDLYPYDYWATYSNSARFDKGWQERFQITYSDLQVANTEERLTEESFAHYRQTHTLLIAYAIPEEEVRMAMQVDHAMIGSDTIIQFHKNNHPRGAGTFSRTIGKYAREKRIITLMEALQMMTIRTAQRLENVAPALENKGRLREGADADITIFDYAEIIDTATPENIASYSEGISYVLVNGTVVRDPEGFRTGVSPGEPIRNSINGEDS